MKTYTAEDVQNILIAFTEEFMVDIPAVHTEAGASIPYSELEDAADSYHKDWFEDIASAATAIGYVLAGELTIVKE